MYYSTIFNNFYFEELKLNKYNLSLFNWGHNSCHKYECKKICLK